MTNQPDPNSEVEEDFSSQRVTSYGISPTLVSWCLALLFGIGMPLLFKVSIFNFIDLLAPSAPLPVAELGEVNTTQIDTNSTVNFVDQLTTMLTKNLTIIWFIAMAYMFVFIFQMRIVMVYGKFVNALPVIVTMFTPFAVLVLIPLWINQLWPS